MQFPRLANLLLQILDSFAVTFLCCQSRRNIDHLDMWSHSLGDLAYFILLLLKPVTRRDLLPIRVSRFEVCKQQL